MNVIVFLFIFLKNAIYGISVFFTGELTASVDVLDILALRFLMSFAAMWLFKTCKVLKIDVGFKDLLGKTKRSKYIKSLVLTALFEPVLYMFFETLGIANTTSITVAVILSLSPITSCICESIILKEKTTFMKKIFLGIGIIGVLYIALNTNTTGGKDTVSGIIFIVCAVVCGSLFATFSREASKAFNSMEVTYFCTILGMIVFNVVNVVRHFYHGDIVDYFKPYFDVDNIIGFVFLAVISTIVATSMNNYALQRVQPSTVAAFGGVSTMVTIVAGVIFNKEVLHDFQMIGLTLIIIRMIGVSYIDIKGHQHLFDLQAGKD